MCMNSVPGVMQLESKGLSFGGGNPLAANSASASAVSLADRNLKVFKWKTKNKKKKRGKIPSLSLLVHLGSWSHTINCQIQKLAGFDNMQQSVYVVYH